MDNRYIGLIIGLVVGVLMIGSLLVPTINEASTTEKTFTNNGGYYTMNELNSSDESTTYTFEWEKATTTILTINGVAFDAYEKYGSAITTIIAAEDWLIRYNSINNEYGYCQYFDGTWVGNLSTKAVSLTASNGTATFTHTASNDTVTTKSLTYTKLYVIQPDSTLDVMKMPTEKPYVRGDSEIYALGITNFNDIASLVQIDGNIDDGLTIDVVGVDGEIIDNVVIDKVAVNGYKDLYVIEKITFDVTISETTTSCTYNYFIVPYQVTAELSNHLDAGEIAMIAVIPVLMIASLLIFAVRFVTRD